MPRNLRNIPWVISEFHGIFWNSLEFFQFFEGISKNILENFWKYIPYTGISHLEGYKRK